MRQGPRFDKVSFNRSKRSAMEGYDLSDDEDERASAMIAAPGVRSTKGFVQEINREPKIIDLTDQHALKLAGRKSRMFSALKRNNIRRRYRKKKKKQKEKPLTDKEKVELDPTQHPYYQQHKIQKKVSISQVNEHNINPDELRQVLLDFYAFYDPVTSQDEITEILHWTLQHGLKKLNERLIAKFNTGLILTEAIINKRKTTVFRNHKNVAHSARINRSLRTPGLADRNKTVNMKYDMTKLDAAIVVLERSQSVTEIKDSLIDIYRIAEPDRLEKWFKGETKDFITEILAWTFRFGVGALASNLREKYSLSNARDTKASLNLQQESATAQANAPEWRDPKYVANCLQRFYIVYNPGRLERSLQPLVDYILDSGVEEFNKILIERYNDNLFTFENADHVKWRGELVQKLFDFFSKVDPQVISHGLNNLIHWTERQDGKITALNEYLQQKYNCDLTSLNA